VGAVPPAPMRTPSSPSTVLLTRLIQSAGGDRALAASRPEFSSRVISFFFCRESRLPGPKAVRRLVTLGGRVEFRLRHLGRLRAPLALAFRRAGLVHSAVRKAGGAGRLLEAVLAALDMPRALPRRRRCAKAPRTGFYRLVLSYFQAKIASLSH